MALLGGSKDGWRLTAVIRLSVPDRPLVEQAVIGFGAAAKFAREVRPHLLRATDRQTIDVDAYECRRRCPRIDVHPASAMS